MEKNLNVEKSDNKKRKYRGRIMKSLNRDGFYKVKTHHNILDFRQDFCDGGVRILVNLHKSKKYQENQLF